MAGNEGPAAEQLAESSWIEAPDGLGCSDDDLCATNRIELCA